MPMLGNVVENKKNRPTITPGQYEDAYEVWIMIVTHSKCNRSKQVGVDRTWSPSNLPRIVPRTEDRKHDLSTWLCGLHDPAALRRPELIIAEELDGGD